MIPLRTIHRWRRWRRPSLQALRWVLLFASIAPALLMWQIGDPWVALLIGGSGSLIGVAGVWWQWATRQRPPRRPTLFVVRYRQQQAMRLLRSVEADLSRNIEMVETLVRQVDDLNGAMDAGEGSGVRDEV